MDRRAYLTASTAVATGLAGCLAGCLLSMVSSEGPKPGTITCPDGESVAPEPDGSVSVRGAWSTSQFDAQNTGHNPATRGPGPCPQVQWQTQLEVDHFNETYREVHSAPVVVDGTMYLTARIGTLFALDAATGSEQWRRQNPYPNAFTPTVVDDVVYFTVHMEILAVDTSGDLLWLSETDPGGLQGPEKPHYYVSHAPTVVNDVLYAGTDEGTLWALDAVTGEERWQFHAPLPDPTKEREANNRSSFEGSPAVAGGIVYVGGRNQVVYALDVDTGDPIWERRLEYEIIGAVTVANETVYVTTETDVLALDPADGSLRWSLHDGVNYRVARGSPAVVNDRLFVATGNALENLHLAALDASDGRVLWENPGYLNRAADPCATRDTVYFAVGSDTVAYDAETGAERWRLHRSRSSTTGSPAVVGGVVYVADTSGHVFAIA